MRISLGFPAAIGISKNETDTLGGTSIRNCFQQWLEVVTLRRLVILFLTCAQNISTYFLPVGQSIQLGRPYLVGCFWDAPEPFSSLSSLATMDCTNGIVPCPFGQSPPNLLVWSKTFLTVLPSFKINLSHEERNPRISCASLSPCCICEKRAGFLCSFLFLCWNGIFKYCEQTYLKLKEIRFTESLKQRSSDLLMMLFNVTFMIQTLLSFIDTFLKLKEFYFCFYAPRSIPPQISKL